MKAKRKKRVMWFKIVAVLFFILISALYAYADSEGEFKSICLAIAKDVSEIMSFKDAESVPAELEKRVEDNLALQSQELRRIVQANPQSIWADDAQYILASLNARYPQQQANELEYLLKKYPDINIEEWTKVNLPWMTPDNTPIAVRIELLTYYKESANEDKLKMLYDESIKKFPEKEQLFTNIIKK